MARKPRGKRAENLGDFAGPDHDKETIEKLSAAAAKENVKIGHNGGEPPDEVVTRNFDAIELAISNVDAGLKIVQKARADLGVARKTAKTDLGSKAWVESLVAAVKLKRQADKGGAGELVTEHRQIGRILRLKNVPLGTQFKLFAFEDEKVAGGEVAAGMDAELQGQHAYGNSEPLTNNPFQPGTQEHVDWGHGWTQAQTAKVRSMGPANGTEASTH